MNKGHPEVLGTRHEVAKSVGEPASYVEELLLNIGCSRDDVACFTRGYGFALEKALQDNERLGVSKAFRTLIQTNPEL